MTVRLACAADVDGVLSLIREMPELPQWGREALAVIEPERERAAGPVRRLFVAEEVGVLAGFAQIVVLLDEAELESIAVRRDLQRRGVGRLLLQHAMGAARAAGAVEFRLEMRQSNRAALRMYKAAGMTVTGTRRRYYSEPTEDAVLLQRSWADGG